MGADEHSSRGQMCISWRNFLFFSHSTPVTLLPIESFGAKVSPKRGRREDQTARLTFKQTDEAKKKKIAPWKYSLSPPFINDVDDNNNRKIIIMIELLLFCSGRPDLTHEQRDKCHVWGKRTL